MGYSQYTEAYSITTVVPSSCSEKKMLAVTAEAVETRWGGIDSCKWHDF